MRREAGWIAPKPEYFTHSYGVNALCIEKTDFCPLPSAQLLEKRRKLRLSSQRKGHICVVKLRVICAVHLGEQHSFLLP